jgi:hypothetical protein
LYGEGGNTMNRKWLIEETGEVRKVNPGEYYLTCIYHHVGLDEKITKWESTSFTNGQYPILKVTEITEKPERPIQRPKVANPKRY